MRSAIAPGRSPSSSAIRSLPDEGGFGVYVHWPFCAAECPYCDFNSHVRAGVDQAAFVSALAAELAHAHALSGPRAVTSIFFGGGTPSLMEGATVAHLLETIDALWGIPPEVEITLEANPTSVEARRFAAYARAGVNRVSLGVQALDEVALRALGRRHTAAEALAAVALAQDVFPRVSFDLIYARPGQTVAMWQRELEAALRHAGDHLSLYQLTIEEGTPFFDLHARGALVVPDEEAAAALYEATQAIMAAHGFAAYEVSNHARPGGECRHNLLYWRYGDYVGAGPGAHGRLTIDGAKTATLAAREPSDWLARVHEHGHGFAETTRLAPEEAAREYLLMGLRISEGISLAHHAALGGELNEAALRDLTRLGLIETEGDRLRVSAHGRPVLNAVIAQLAGN